MEDMADYKKADAWQIKARKEGYPARSVYKLMELDEKFGLFRRARADGGLKFRALDLGAAPGSWSMYALKRMAPGARLVAADLSPLSDKIDWSALAPGGFRFEQGDITDPALRASLVADGPYSLIISDAAPATTGNRFVDTCRSLDLALEVASYARDALEPGGALALKVFQGGDTAELLKALRALFKTAKSHKPKACRSDSFETYYVAQGRLA